VWRSPEPTGAISTDLTRMQSEVAIYAAEAFAAYQCEQADNAAKLEANKAAEKALAGEPK